MPMLAMPLRVSNCAATVRWFDPTTISHAWMARGYEGFDVFVVLKNLDCIAIGNVDNQEQAEALLRRLGVEIATTPMEGGDE